MRDREAVLHTGDAIMMGAGEGGFIVTPDDCRFFSAAGCQSPHSDRRVKRPGDLVGRPIPAQTPALQLLTHYLGMLDDEQALATPELQHQIVAHIHDLIALTVGASHDTIEIAEGRGVRAARLRAIKEDIVNGLRDGEVSVGTIAAKHRVSLRYVQLLFEEDGHDLHRFRAGAAPCARVSHADRPAGFPARRLPRWAYDAGFSDPSYLSAASAGNTGWRRRRCARLPGTPTPSQA